MLIFALFLVALNGPFVAAEFAFVKIRATQVDRLVREGKTSAGLVEEATNKLDAYLSVCQLGITISSLGLGWLGEPAFAHILEPLLVPLGIPEGSVHLIAFAAAFGTITFFHVVFGELAPRASPSQGPRAPPCSWRPSCASSTTCFCPASSSSMARPTRWSGSSACPRPPRRRRPTPKRSCASSSSSPPARAS